MESPKIPAALAAEVLNTYLIIYVGFVISTALYGITLLQSFNYFRRYPGDSWFKKLLTTAVMIFNTLTTALPAHAIYIYLIKNFGNYLEAEIEPFTYRLENLMSGLLIFLVQGFYTHQIWRLSNGRILTATLIVLVFVTLALRIEESAVILRNGNRQVLDERKNIVIGGLIQGFSSLVDVLITVSLCWLLNSKRTGFRRSEKLIDEFMILAVERGLLTTITQILFLVLYVADPSKVFWLPFHQAVSKFYTSSYLAMLNFRNPTNVTNNQAQIKPDTIVLSKSRNRSESASRTLGLTASETHFESRKDDSVADYELANLKANGNNRFGV